MLKYEDILKDCNFFLDETGYRDLPEVCKIQVNTYMRGLKDGLTLAHKTDHEPELVAV